ncbi:hypothetical protein SAMN06272775_6282 [Streptomyces sp. 2323.1]|uniref:hypothetical protein n=1 Tax=Streptomyces sp. 2323.1 TaxID=1938841 RepID=UPI000BB8EFB2|nr:hypothetical protein [Streptomyces sp. 2323.1]SOE15363.1 hypothetical protein SAMN06272775_6282 [Streptomyces sp. 2323.1]
MPDRRQTGGWCGARGGQPGREAAERPAGVTVGAVSAPYPSSCDHPAPAACHHELRTRRAAP